MKYRKTILFGISAIALTFFIAIIVLRSYFEKNITNQIQNYGLISLFFISAILDIIPQSIGPHFPMAIAIFEHINPILALSVTTLGSLLGTWTAFIVGRRYGMEIVNHLFTKKEHEKVDKKIKRYGKWGVLITSLLPPFPYPPILFGALGMKRRTIFLYGILPRTISYVIEVIILVFLLHI